MTFAQKKIEIQAKLGEVLREYTNFTKDVSPKHWRSTGKHYQSILTAMNDIPRYEQISDKDLENDWVKKEL